MKPQLVAKTTEQKPKRPALDLVREHHHAALRSAIRAIHDAKISDSGETPRGVALWVVRQLADIMQVDNRQLLTRLVELDKSLEWLL